MTDRGNKARSAAKRRERRMVGSATWQGNDDLRGMIRRSRIRERESAGIKKGDHQ